MAKARLSQKKTDGWQNLRCYRKNPVEVVDVWACLLSTEHQQVKIINKDEGSCRCCTVADLNILIKLEGEEISLSRCWMWGLCCYFALLLA